MAEGSELIFDFAPVRHGYGWVFPKHDHLNVGLGVYDDSGAQKLDRGAAFFLHSRTLRRCPRRACNGAVPGIWRGGRAEGRAAGFSGRGCGRFRRFANGRRDLRRDRERSGGGSGYRWRAARRRNRTTGICRADGPAATGSTAIGIGRAVVLQESRSRLPGADRTGVSRSGHQRVCQRVEDRRAGECCPAFCAGFCDKRINENVTQPGCRNRIRSTNFTAKIVVRTDSLFVPICATKPSKRTHAQMAGVPRPSSPTPRVTDLSCKSITGSPTRNQMQSRMREYGARAIRLVSLPLLCSMAACAAPIAWADGPQSSPSIFAPASTPASSIQDLSWFVLAITGGIFVTRRRTAGVGDFSLSRAQDRRRQRACADLRQHAGGAGVDGDSDSDRRRAVPDYGADYFRDPGCPEAAGRARRDGRRPPVLVGIPLSQARAS